MVPEYISSLSSFTAQLYIKSFAPPKDGDAVFNWDWQRLAPETHHQNWRIGKFVRRQRPARVWGNTCCIFSDNKALNRSEQLKEGSGRLLQKRGRQKSLTIPCSDSFTLFQHTFIIFLRRNVITQCTLQNIIYYIIPGGQRFPRLLRNRPWHTLFFSLPRRKWWRCLTAFCQFKLTVYKSQQLCCTCCFTKALTQIIRVTSRFLHFPRAAWTCKTVVSGCQGVAMWLQRCSAWF